MECVYPSLAVRIMSQLPPMLSGKVRRIGRRRRKSANARVQVPTLETSGRLGCCGRCCSGTTTIVYIWYIYIYIYYPKHISDISVYPKHLPHWRHPSGRSWKLHHPLDSPDQELLRKEQARARPTPTFSVGNFSQRNLNFSYEKNIYIYIYSELLVGLMNCASHQFELFNLGTLSQPTWVNCPRLKTRWETKTGMGQTVWLSNFKPQTSHWTTHFLNAQCWIRGEQKREEEARCILHGQSIP